MILGVAIGLVLFLELVILGLLAGLLKRCLNTISLLTNFLYAASIVEEVAINGDVMALLREVKNVGNTYQRGVDDSERQQI